eukprot:gb/GECH01009035.1/.p1 GENE.gb/GECH01009035.1/~~gb/GECH01009035.1/.p1  ORF type:complete len:111 (+),score=17.48 gb/GECH01009035.1/:1-333(+)
MTSSSSPSSNPTLPTSTTSSMDSSRPPPHLSRYQRQRGDMHPVKNFIAGNSGGIVGVLVGHPLGTPSHISIPFEFEFKPKNHLRIDLIKVFSIVSLEQFMKKAGPVSTKA